MLFIIQQEWYRGIFRLLAIARRRFLLGRKGEKNMKKVLKLMLALVMTCAVAGCSSSSKNDADVTITIGTSPDYAPYESLNKKGEIVGFDVDMAKLFEGYLSDMEGKTYSLEFKQMDFDNIVTQIQGDQIDLGISGFTYSEDRVVEWSDPYLGTQQVAVVPNGSSITSNDQLVGKKLAAQTGATGEQAAKEVENADVVSMKNVQDIFNGLASNQYDAAIVDLGVAQQYVSSGNFTQLNGSLMDEKNYVIAKKGNTKMIKLMNKCIKKFLASKDYDKLCKKYDLSPLEK